MSDREAQQEERTSDRFKHLPPRPRPEDLRTSQDVVPYGEPLGEADREREWLLRTTGIFI
jgi:hypothetical protein